MKHRTLIVGLCIAAGCTYNEYKNYYTTPEEGAVYASDAGIDRASNGGSSGAGGGSGAGSAGQAGSAAAAAGGGGAPPGEDCTGCARISVLSGRAADYQLDFASRQNLSTSLVLFRVRVRDYVGDVYVTAYIESGDHLAPEQGLAAESQAITVTLNVGSGWQDVGMDLQQVQAFQAPRFEDDAGGGTAGGAFNPGFPFDKSRVRRVGMRIAPNAGFGVFTPATLELDSVSFSSAPALNVDFATDPGDFELVDPESGSVSHVGG